MNSNDAYFEALERLADRGFEFGGFLSNHGPMAADALVVLGEADAVVPWIDGYRSHLEIDPETVQPIKTRDDWRVALGDFRRVADWTTYFRQQLSERGVNDVSAEWWLRLLPGSAGGATHGLIRTAHALRAFKRTQGTEPLVLDEVARGFGYWAARYSEIAPLPPLDGNLSAHAAFLQVPLLADVLEPKEPGITPKLQALQSHAEFERATSRYGNIAGIDTAFSELTREAAQLFVDRVTGDNIFAVVHALTAPAALRMTLPSLPDELRLPSLATAWQLLAAITSAYSPTSLREPALDAPDEVPTGEALVAAAVENGDEHAIKYTEACLREYAIAGDRIYLDAASLITKLL